MDNHKAWVKSVFDKAASTYAKNGYYLFDEFGKDLVATADIQPEHHVLDIATGSGSILCPAAQAIGPEGSITGIDISPEMIEAAKANIANFSCSNVELTTMDAEILDFPNASFDRVFCGFALFFFSNLSQALAQCYRVLKPGGKLIVSTFGNKPELISWLVSYCQQLGAKRYLGVNKLSTESLLEEALAKARFTSTHMQKVRKTCTYESIEIWWQSLWSHGARSLLEQLSPSQIEHVKAEALLKTPGSQPVYEELTALFAISEKT